MSRYLKRRMTITLDLDVPEGVPTSELRQYIHDALVTWGLTPLYCPGPGIEHHHGVFVHVWSDLGIRHWYEQQEQEPAAGTGAGTGARP